MSDDDRQRILARRAKFLAAAVAALSVEACKPSPPPEVCLSAQPCLSVQPEPEPQPCLSQPMDPDAGPEPEPQVCLSQPMPLEPEKKPGEFAEPPPGKS